MLTGGSGRWREIDAVFSAALDREPPLRSAFLQEACGGDAELREAVEELLHSEFEARSFLRTPIVSVADRVGPDPDAAGPEGEAVDLAGTHVGRYRLIREIARGGMGTVYLAERADGEFRQRVAVKLLRRGLDTDDVLARFRAERQILASLNHPHIARLLDGGATEDGRPYLVMEYVEGQSITEYCDAWRLTVEQRLGLFCTVARAVQYAHRNLVVHRDLKPSNILIDVGGEPRLLDFGIAKLLDAPAWDEAPLTHPGARLMTPAYASPEQRRGSAVTTASDIYQLGMLLYRLLSGVTPPRAGEPPNEPPGSAEAWAEPIPPSEAVARGADLEATTPVGGDTRRRLRGRLRGDLDNIVGMALRTDADHRYASADQLVEDIERHLHGQPVIARREARGYRVRKFLRRNAVGVATLATLGCLLVAYAVTITVQSRRIAQERDVARLEAAEMEAMTYFLVEFFWGGDPREPMRDPEIGRLLLEAGEDRLERQSHRPKLQARMMDVLGQVYSMLGELDRAAPLLERSVATMRRVHGEAHPDVANSLARLAFLHQLREDHTAAERLNRQAVEIYREVGRTDYPQYANILKYLALSLTEQGRHEEAERAARESVALRRRLLHEDHGDIATSLSILGTILYRKGDPHAALVPYRDALVIRERIYPREHVLLAVSRQELGEALRATGDENAAEPLLREALEILGRQVADDHPERLAAQTSLGLLLVDRERFEEAEALLLASYRRLCERHGDADRRTVAALQRLSALYAAWSRPPPVVPGGGRCDARVTG